MRVRVRDLNRCVFLALKVMNGRFPNPNGRGWYRCVGTVSQGPSRNSTNERVHRHHTQTDPCTHTAHLCTRQAPEMILLHNEKDKKLSVNKTGR